MTTEVADDLLTADAEGTAAAIDDIAGDLVRQLDVAIQHAVEGDREAVGTYIATWRRLEERLLHAVREAAPDVVVGFEGTTLLLEANGRRRPSAWADALPLEAPFSPWAERFGRGLGCAIAFIAYLRSQLAIGAPLTLPTGEAEPNVRDEPTAESVRRFLRFAVQEIGREQSLLSRIAELFELSRTELGRLFGVRRQAVSQWLDAGVPPARAPKANAVARVADVLERNLRHERIPGVVRQSAEAYGGLTMLEMIERDRHEELVRLVEEAFDWATAA